MAQRIDRDRYSRHREVEYASHDDLMRIGTTVAKHGEALQGLASQISDVKKILGELSSSINAARGTPWMTLLSAGMLILAIVGLGGTGLILPLKVEMTAADKRFDSFQTLLSSQVNGNRDLVIETRRASEASDMESRADRAAINAELQKLNERFREIETQFAANHEQHNTDRFNLERIDYVMWRKLFPDTPLPEPSATHFGLGGRYGKD